MPRKDSSRTSSGRVQNSRCVPTPAGGRVASGRRRAGAIPLYRIPPNISNRGGRGARGLGRVEGREVIGPPYLPQGTHPTHSSQTAHCFTVVHLFPPGGFLMGPARPSLPKGPPTPPHGAQAAGWGHLVEEELRQGPCGEHRQHARSRPRSPSDPWVGLVRNVCGREANLRPTDRGVDPHSNLGVWSAMTAVPLIPL